MQDGKYTSDGGRIEKWCQTPFFRWGDEASDGRSFGKMVSDTIFPLRALLEYVHMHDQSIARVQILRRRQRVVPLEQLRDRDPEPLRDRVQRVAAADDVIHLPRLILAERPDGRDRRRRPDRRRVLADPDDELAADG